MFAEELGAPVEVFPETPVDGDAEGGADALDQFGERGVGEAVVELAVLKPFIEIGQEAFDFLLRAPSMAWRNRASKWALAE